MADPRTIHPVDIYLRRRASDRARERASRAAYFGDRAGLLIATGSAKALMSTRFVADRDIGPDVKAEPVGQG
jgi:hypothetical protein